MGDHRKEAWWTPKISSAIASYWIYQQAGNMCPRAEDDPMWSGAAATGRAERPVAALRSLRPERRPRPRERRWSFHATSTGRADRHGLARRPAARPGRPADGQRGRVGLDHAQATGDVDHLLLGTSFPWLIAPAMHDLEAWTRPWPRARGPAGREASARRRGGPPISSTGPPSASPSASWPSSCGRSAPASAGPRPRPSSPLGRRPPRLPHRGGLSGRRRGRRGLAGRVLADAQPAVQARAGACSAACAPARPRRWPAALRKSAGVADPPPLRWREVAGPSFDNQLATLEIDGPPGST